MKFTQVIQSVAASSEATVLMLGADGKQYSITLTTDVVSQLQVALLDVASRLRKQQGTHGMLIDVQALDTFWSEDGRGLVFELKGGGEFALNLDDPKLRSALRACIDKLETPDSGPIH